MSSFFQYQKESRRAARLLWISFGIGLFLLFVSVNVALALALKAMRLDAYFDASTYVMNSFFLLTLILGGAWNKWEELKEEGPIGMVLALGGKLLDRDIANEKEKILLNVVQEMAVAASLSVPEVFLLEKESGINAFAAGLAPSRAVIAVTKGALEFLTRDELQALVAHEFSHILNGDMVRNTHLLALLHGFFVLTHLGAWLAMPSTRVDGRPRTRSPFALIGLVLLVFGWVCQFWGRLIQAAVSRRQEGLADASAVQFTRHAGSLVSLLSKIGGWNSHLHHPSVRSFSHFFIASPFQDRRWDIFATHPPLLDRIRKIFPGFHGPFLKIDSEQRVKLEREIASLAPQRAKERVLAKASGFHTIPAEEVLHQLSRLPPMESVHAAQYFVGDLPEPLLRSLHDPFEARAALASLLFSNESAEILDKQKDYLNRFESKDFVALAEKLGGFISDQIHGSKLSLLEIGAPALRKLTDDQRHQFLSHIKALIAMDGQVSIFEFIYAKLLIKCLEPHATHHPDYFALRPLLPDAAILLSFLSRHQAKDEIEARMAFAMGAAKLQISPSELVSCEKATLKDLDRALRELVRASIPVKRKIFEACFFTAATDGEVQLGELELLRLLAALFEMPLPLSAEEWAKKSRHKAG